MFKINFLSTVTTVSWIWFVTSSWSCSIIPIYNIHTSPTNPIPVPSSPKNLQACHIQVILVLTSKDYSLQYHFISTLSGLLGFLWWSLHLCIIRVSVFSMSFTSAILPRSQNRGIKCCNCSGGIFLPMLMLIGFLGAITQLVFD